MEYPLKMSWDKSGGNLMNAAVVPGTKLSNTASENDNVSVR